VSRLGATVRAARHGSTSRQHPKSTEMKWIMNHERAVVFVLSLRGAKLKLTEERGKEHKDEDLRTTSLVTSSRTRRIKLAMHQFGRASFIVNFEASRASRIKDGRARSSLVASGRGANASATHDSRRFCCCRCKLRQIILIC
jgi:hypothetical protein